MVSTLCTGDIFMFRSVKTLFMYILSVVEVREQVMESSTATNVTLLASLENMGEEISMYSCSTFDMTGQLRYHI